ncbi:hypothetical protein PENTCL1PPCAC_20315 [Pristionchus entomophagus]|uniref:G protein-coupled receptor n=1 Tax=Pristionchus entomophagus TaxID=358040 RepID=A0AAV5TUI7_9BILA|nr:hypothetical protein PENTCL1PPCAC_20314 [Pristionchus entomophagus]GMS98140.1 hypothetical protein PENTCL1PPCAC_20315 [Pristionchus entomophagus]
MEILNFVVCFLTLRIMRVSSHTRQDAYTVLRRCCVLLSLLSQQLILFGPVFLEPIIGKAVRVFSRNSKFQSSDI